MSAFANKSQTRLVEQEPDQWCHELQLFSSFAVDHESVLCVCSSGAELATAWIRKLYFRSDRCCVFWLVYPRKTFWRSQNSLGFATSALSLQQLLRTFSRSCMVESDGHECEHFEKRTLQSRLRCCDSEKYVHVEFWKIIEMKPFWREVDDGTVRD